MKRLFFSTMLLVCAFADNAQNLQLHYDFGRHAYSTHEEGRQAFTATWEQFKADNLGSWFYFIDLDFDKNGVSAAYTEVSREFTFAKPCESGSFAAHIEYNGGLSRGAGSYQQCALLGAAWNGHNADFSKTYSLQLMYKNFFGQEADKFNAVSSNAYASFQVTGVWGITFADKKMTFSGFADLWRQQKANKHGYLVFLAEPQLWYNVTNKFSVGTEVELSNNFIYSNKDFKNNRFYVNPTLALKYNF